MSGSHQTSSPPRMVTTSGYRGTFSSSICGMFESSRYSRTDSCALACCGVWLWERNAFAVTGKLPASWKERPILLTALAVMTAFCVTLASIRSSAVPVGEETGANNGDADPNAPSDPAAGVAFVLFVCGFILTCIMLCQFSAARQMFRRDLAMLTFRKRSAEGQSDDRFVREHNYEINNGHSLCGCYRNDIASRSVVVNGTSLSDDAIDGDGQGTPMHNPGDADLCGRIWNLLQSTCCNFCCSCWCLCSGMCATAQEYRHIDKLTQRGPIVDGTEAPLSNWKRDYITLQPWSEYMPGIINLRDTGNGSFIAHIRSMSNLSSRLLSTVLAVLAFVLIVLVFTSQPWQFCVLLGALAQPCVFLFVFYWVWNRFDISLDATVKCFASGFFICTGMALAYEMLVQVVTGILSVIVGLFSGVLLVASGEIDLGPIINATNSSSGDPAADQEAWNEAIPKGYLYFNAVFGAFLNAFVVAALVEEISKYLTFWMVEHEDLRTNEELALSEASREVVQEEGNGSVVTGDGNTTPPKATFVSRGAAVTIGMMATALGFACAENLLYVFVYTPPGLQMEIATLVMRSLFPVHPIAAALQSIGVCRRDLENDPSVGLGRILRPAWILHGLFDFVLMAMAGIDAIDHPKSVKDTDTTADGDAEEMSAEDLVENIASLGISSAIVVVSIFYFFYHARQQRKRLEFMDENQNTSGDVPMLSSMVS